jgi:uncharacterized protein (DUF3084 family)
MNTPTPRTDAAWAKTFQDDDDQCRSGNAASDMRDECAKIETELVTLTGAYTCTHHNDAERTACPVCLVATLTAERDQLRAENTTLRSGQKACEACDEPTAFEVRRLRAEMERLRSDRDCEKRLRKDAEELREDAIARAKKAEADLVALGQCRDDNCRAVVQLVADARTLEHELTRLRAEVERLYYCCDELH